MFGSAAAEDNKIKILDGTPKTIVVNGYSTSFRWPAILQRKLDRYFGYKRVIEVKSATKGGTPIAGWINVETGKPKQPWLETLRPALRQPEDTPVIVLAQQSLQRAFGSRREGIRDANDLNRIRHGADALEKYVKLLKEDGADLVFVAMHIYKKPMEPQIGNERLVLDELMRRNIPGIVPGPDVWTPTKKLYPEAFAKDLLHPNHLGAELMAQKWFVALLKYDRLRIPPWSPMPLRPEFRIPPDARIIYDIEYARTADKKLLLNMYLPKGSAGPLPLIVWIHGGGWRDPNFNKDDRCRPVRLVARGYAVASIEYHLSNEASFPAQIHDCKAAIRWLRANAQKYNLSPDRIGVWGPSAGGHLSALIGTSGDLSQLEGTIGGNLEYSSRVQAVCDWFGPTDLLRHTQHAKKRKTPDSTHALTAIEQLLGGPIENNRDKAALASPVTHVSKDDPPFLIMHGDRDPLVPIEQSRLLYEALKKAGVNVKFHTVKGGRHGMLQTHGFATPEIEKLVDDFFDTHLKLCDIINR